jgi:hypothetical protein
MSKQLNGAAARSPGHLPFGSPGGRGYRRVHLLPLTSLEPYAHTRTSWLSVNGGAVMHAHLWRRRAMRSVSIAAVLIGALALSQPGRAAEFTCASGDVACLIKAMREANDEANTITLEAGIYPLTTVDNNTEGSNGLPSITHSLTLRGAGADTTVIERAAGAPGFRLVHVAATGTLMLEGLTLRGGLASSRPQLEPGGGLLNDGGVVALTRTILTGNAAGSGGGLANRGGTVLLTQTLVARNKALSPTGGGGLLNTGTLILSETTLAHNWAESGGGLTTGGTALVTNATVVGNEAAVGAGVFQGGGMLTIVTTTFARNHAVVEGGGLFGRMATLINATLTDNSGGRGGGIAGSAVLLNTVLARNTSVDLRSIGLRSPDCVGHVISLGTNLLGDPTGCTITLHAADRTGDLGAGEFISDGPLGRGHVPLLQNSLAVDAGNPTFCPPADQLGQLRVGVCDIGAVEFQPSTPTQAAAVDIRPRTFPSSPPRPPSRPLDKDHLLEILKGEPFPPTLSRASEPLPPKRLSEKGCLLKILKGESC